MKLLTSSEARSILDATVAYITLVREAMNNPYPLKFLGYWDIHLNTEINPKAKDFNDLMEHLNETERTLVFQWASASLEESGWEIKDNRVYPLNT